MITNADIVDHMESVVHHYDTEIRRALGWPDEDKPLHLLRRWTTEWLLRQGERTHSLGNTAATARRVLDGLVERAAAMGRNPDTYDGRAVAAYEAAGSTSEDRQKALFAMAGVPDLEARVEAVDLARENDVIRTVMQAQRIGAGWTGNATDVMHLHRALKRAGLVP